MSEKYTVEQITEIAKALGITQKNDPASTTLSSQTLHGPNISGTSTTQYGLFTTPGVRPDMLSTLVRPDSMLSLATIQRSEYTNEILDIMTGQTEGSGDNADGFCDDPPEAGDLKVMERVFKFGSWFMKTKLNSVPELGQLKNRADVPRNILNAGPAASPFIPDIMFNLNDTRSQLRLELFKLGTDLQRSLEYVAVQGTQGTSSAANARGWFKQFDGIDTQIKTGYTDSVSGVLTPAADSAVITFGADIAATIAGGDGRNIVNAITDLFYGLQDRARKVGMEGTQWAFVMRAEAFRALTDQWVCSYATNRCDDGSAGNPLNRDVTAQNNMRLEMLNGRYLWVDGQQVPVVFSEGIPNSQSSNFVFESDIYLVPYQWAGMPLLRVEYFPMDNPYATEYGNFEGMEDVRVINNGMFMVGRRNTGLCIEYLFASKMRMILEAPFLAGRVDNVSYTFRAPIRNAYPGASFYANGGATYRS